MSRRPGGAWARLWLCPCPLGVRPRPRVPCRGQTDERCSLTHPPVVPGLGRVLFPGISYSPGPLCLVSLVEIQLFLRHISETPLNSAEIGFKSEAERDGGSLLS